MHEADFLNQLLNVQKVFRTLSEWNHFRIFFNTSLRKISRFRVLIRITVLNLRNFLGNLSQRHEVSLKCRLHLGCCCLLNNEFVNSIQMQLVVALVNAGTVLFACIYDEFVLQHFKQSHTYQSAKNVTIILRSFSMLQEL